MFKQKSMLSEPNPDYIVSLDPVFQLDANLGATLLQSFCACQPPLKNEIVGKIVAAVGAWFTRNPEVAKALVAGCSELSAKNAGGRGLDLYVDAVTEAGRVTPVLARSAAEKFVVICAADDKLLYDLSRGFFREIGSWGPYPLGQVSNGILTMQKTGGPKLAVSFARMIGSALKQGVVEKELVRLVERLVTGINGFNPDKRLWQAIQFERVIAVDRLLAPAFLRGFERGVRFLKEPQLREFVDVALAGDDQGDRRSRFLGLEAIAGRGLCQKLQTMAPLTAQLTALHRYLKARSGQAVSARPLKEIPRSPLAYQSIACTDGNRIFLPPEMELGGTVEENETYYRLLAGLELAAIEARSFAFDFNRWQHLQPPPVLDNPELSAPPEAFKYSDYYTFFAIFPNPDLAEKLFNLAEFARIQGFLERYYPGFAKRAEMVTGALPLKTAEFSLGEQLAYYLYSVMVSRPLPPEFKPGSNTDFPAEFSHQWRQIVAAAAPLKKPKAQVEAAADWVAMVYPQVEKILAAETDLRSFIEFSFPFQRRLRFDLVYLAHQENERKAHLWREKLAEQGAEVDKSLLKNILNSENLELTPELLKQLLERSGNLRNRAGAKIKKLPPEINLQELFPDAESSGTATELSEPVPTFWYDEWDYRLNDYLKNHVKLLEQRRVAGDDDFYQQAISENSGLINRIRRNFELIRPEAIQILRHWPEGDAFDYDALLEYALDRKLRITPDERLYRKRLKVDRDVAVFVLVDLSSSTRKAVQDGSGKSILAVEKEALVLFCEALERVGDHYALAGFSGSGRLATEFFYLKDFSEPLNDEIKGRIGGIRPEKNTRMGPAIRHAAKALKAYPARIKLMIILSDGLPNDQDYSNEYAIADSRSAIRESRSDFIHVHAITVNASNSVHLDNLYGDVHHTVIADVKQLPDKLPRIYRALTRQ